MNDDDDPRSEKLVVSFMAAVTVPWAIAAALGILTGSSAVMLILGFGLSAWTLIGGYQSNGEMEESIGAFLGKMTDYVIPRGVSWWIPRPLGTAVRKTSIDKRSLDRSIGSGKPITQVKTRNGGTVLVGVVMAYHVEDTRIVANFEPGALETQANALLDRGTRFYALYFDSEDDHSPEEGSALANRKAEFSAYLMGKPLKDADGNPRPHLGLRRRKATDDEKAAMNNERDFVDEWIEIPCDIPERAKALGIAIDLVDVVDVNEPLEVQQANNLAAAEVGQAKAEKRDIGSVRERFLEMKWGTSDPAEIARMIAANEKPLIDVDDDTILQAVRTARGDLVAAHVSGNAGDFTKAEVLRNAMQGRQPNKRK
jgi:hypothetical protein